MIFDTFNEAKLMARLTSYITGQVTPIEKLESGKYNVTNIYLFSQNGIQMLSCSSEISYTHSRYDNYTHSRYEFPELALFDIFIKLINDGKNRIPAWLEKSELGITYLFIYETIYRLKIKHYRIKINLDMEAGDMNYQSSKYIQSLAESYAESEKYREYDEDIEELDEQENNLLWLEECIKEIIDELGLNIPPRERSIYIYKQELSSINDEVDCESDDDKKEAESAAKFEEQLDRWNCDPEENDHE